MLPSMHAVITAGGRVSGELEAVMGTSIKALARVGGTTLLSRTIAAARGVGATAVAVVGGQEVRAAVGGEVDLVIAESASGAENVHLALTAFPNQALLYLTSDLPFLRTDLLQAFLDRVPPHSLAMPLASAQAYERRFPAAPEHSIVVGSERISNGSVFVLPAGIVPLVDSVAQKLFDARKNALRMAVFLGPALLVKFALRRISIADVERKASRVLGCPAFGVRDCAPELCFDIDTFEDLRYARAHA